MARARRRKSIQSNKLTYYIIGAAVLILIIFAFPNVGKFTANLTDSGSGVEIELTTPDQEILQPGGTGVINFTFRNVQDFDTLSFKTYLPNGALVYNGIWLSSGPLTSSNTNVVIGGDSQFGTNATTLNFQGTNGVNIPEQNISLIFTTTGGAYNGTNLSKIVISNTLFGDSNGNAIALFSNLSRYNVVPANLPPTVRIHSPSSGSSWPNSDTDWYSPMALVLFEFSANDSDGTITNLSKYLNGNLMNFGTGQTHRTNMPTPIGNHTFTVIARDDDGANTTATTSFEVYNATVPTSAAVAVISSPSSQQTYYVGEDIFFNGSDSYSINSSIASYNWVTSYPYSGQWRVYNNSATFIHEGPNNAGNYSIHFNVTDNNGAIGLTNLRIQVTALGDVNGDGRITGADVTASEWISVGVNRNYVIQNADTNQDGSRNSLDITGTEIILLR